MKKDPWQYFKILPIFSLLVFAPIANAQYLSEADSQKKAASEKKAATQAKIDAVLGKTFWYRPGASDSMRTEFFEKYGKDERFTNLNILDFSGKFYLTKEASFKVIAADLKMIQIEFEDGKIAFIKPYVLAEHGDYPLIKNLYPGRERANNYEAYIYPDAPFKIENPKLFAAIDSTIGKKFWYRPASDATTKLNFVEEIKGEVAFIIENYKVASDTIDIKVRLEDESTRLLKIEKSTLINFSSGDLPFIYAGKDKSLPSKEYLYPGRPDEIIAAQESTSASKTASAAKEKAAVAEERLRLKKDAMAALAKELKSVPKSFEVRGLNFGADHHQDLAETQGFVSEKGLDLDRFPDTRSETTINGGILYFYRNILFMATFEDLQDSVEIRAAMNQLEAKYKSKFAPIPLKTTRDGNIETATRGFRMNISNSGAAEIKIASSGPISKMVCMQDISREMRRNIELRIKNYDSLTDRVERECRATVQPIEMKFTNTAIEALVLTRANTEQKERERQAADERIKSALKKAKEF